MVAWRRVWPCARLWEHAYLAGGIVCSRLSASRSHRKVTVCTPRRRGVPFTRVKGTKTRLGLCPKTPFSLSCGWIRTMRSIVRTAPQIRSQGACGAFYFGFSRNRMKINTLSASSNPAPGSRPLAFRAGCTDASGL